MFSNESFFRDKELTDWIKSEWEKSGFDHVELVEHDVYLSWPNQSNPNKIYLFNEGNELQFESQHFEKELKEGDADPEVSIKDKNISQ